jgi:hypothetical protein
MTLGYCPLDLSPVMSSTLVRTGDELPNCHLITIVIMSIVGKYFWSGYLRRAKSLECGGEGVWESNPPTTARAAAQRL